MIKIDRTLQGRVKLGILEMAELICLLKHPELWQQFNELAGKYRRQYPEPSSASGLLKPARDLYHAIGMEPTRIRPSSEALFRRAVKNKPYYQINSIVDAGNFCSLSFMLPIGLYDRDKIEGGIALRKGLKGESYTGIGKDVVNVENRFTLADNPGAFGNPSADSLRTAISLSTRNILLVIFAPASYPDTQLVAHLNLSESVMKKYNSGQTIKKMIEAGG